MKQTKNEIHNDSYGSVLRLPSFCVLLAGRLISGAGQILFSMATMWYILQLTESALAAALIPMLPYFIYAFWAYHWLQSVIGCPKSSS